ncbi:hypothetical protein [Portibacter marinus]|uniref:hypothetical protein n=1 Tax=Portibacter marinus TaxID=2898660 RepID=UPI001F48832A|nr:hypothetical protein [Portibacter marinus]
MRIIIYNMLFFLFITINLSAQVGVNTIDPDQTFDVNGKMKIGNDGRTPSEGTLRYGPTGDFEGFTGNGWTSFTEKSGPLPTGPRPVTGYLGNVLASETLALSFLYSDGSGSFTSIPTGKYLMITSVIIQSNSLAKTGEYQTSIGPGSSFPIGSRGLFLTGNRTSIQSIHDPLGLLIIGRAGENIVVTNQSTSEFTVRVSVRGFVVDDLSYE